MQKPKLTIEQLEQVQAKERGTQISSTLGHVPRVVRQRVLPHETRAQARKRWAREAEMEEEQRRHGAPRAGGRILPMDGAE